MARRRNPLSRIRLVYQRSKPLTKVAVAVVIVLSMAALISLKAARQSAELRIDSLYAQAVALIQENDGLRADIANLGTPESVEKIAQEELDLVKPGTIIFHTGK